MEFRGKLLQPQEVEAYFVIPALRRELAVALKAQGIKPSEISNRLGVTPAAVSQYCHSKRADLDLGEPMRTYIRAAAKRVKNPLSSMTEIQQLLRIAMREKVMCRVHEKIGTLPKGCAVCFN